MDILFRLGVALLIKSLRTQLGIGWAMAGSVADLRYAQSEVHDRHGHATMNSCFVACPYVDLYVSMWLALATRTARAITLNQATLD